MKRVCLMVGHWNIENITSESLRSWRDPTVLKRSTGASGERDYHWNQVMPKLRDKLIAAGIQVYISDATYKQEIYSQEYDLWIALHYDGGGDADRCMVSAPDRTTIPAYLHETAQVEAERFCQIWKTIYPPIVGVPYKEEFITEGMKDYYAFDYVGYDTPSVIVEHFNHSSVKGGELKGNPDLIAEADFKAIVKFLGIPEQPPVIKDVYQILYKGQVLQEYDYNPSDRINELSGQMETSQNKVAELTSKMATLQADYDDLSALYGEVNAQYSTAKTERDNAKSALSAAENVIKQRDEEIKFLQDKIDKLQSADPLQAYSWSQLLSAGWKKFWVIKKGTS